MSSHWGHPSGVRRQVTHSHSSSCHKNLSCIDHVLRPWKMGTPGVGGGLGAELGSGVAQARASCVTLGGSLHPSGPFLSCSESQTGQHVTGGEQGQPLTSCMGQFLPWPLQRFGGDD